MRVLRAIPWLVLFFFGAAMMSFGVMELMAGRLEWAALLVAGTAVCVGGMRLQIAAGIDAHRNTPRAWRPARVLERAVQLVWVFAGGAATAFGAASWGAGQQKTATVYLMAAGVCALGLAVQLTATRVFDRHSR